MYIIGPVRTAHFGRCRSFPNRFRIRRKAAADLGGGYFFRSRPNLIAAITSISNAMVSAVLMRSPPLRGNNRTVLTGEPHHTRFALLCQFSAPPAGRLLLCVRLTPCFSQNAWEAQWDLPENQSSGLALMRIIFRIYTLLLLRKRVSGNKATPAVGDFDCWVNRQCDRHNTIVY